MAWTYTENFNTLNTAEIVGQGSWTGATGKYDVVTTAPYEGAKCLRMKSGVATDEIDQSVGAIGDGTFYVAVKMTKAGASAASLRIDLDSASTRGVIIVIDEATLSVKAYNSTTLTDSGLDLIDGAWNIIGINYSNTNKNFTFNLNGGVFTGAYGYFNATQNVTVLALLGSGTLTNDAFLDSIQPTYPYRSSDINNNCISLNGSSQYLTAADSASLSVTGDLTMEIWANFSSVPGGDTLCTLIQKGDAQSNALGSYYFAYRTASKTLGGTIWDGTTSSFTEVSWEPTANTWYHIAMTFTASTGDVKYFINGSQQGTTQSTARRSINNSSYGLTIGEYIQATPQGFYFPGKLDEVRIWNITRTATDINANKSKRIVSYPGLVASWSLDNTLTDSSGNGNTLTNVGSATFSTDVSALTSVISVLDSYNQSNRDASSLLCSGYGLSNTQSFTTPNDGLSWKAVESYFWLCKGNSPTGSVYSRLYAHSGTYGTSSVPTGSSLQDSGALDISTLATQYTYALKQFTFATPVSLTANTNYVLGIEFTGGNASNGLDVGVDSSSPTHSGNYARSTNLSSWTANNSQDICFYVIGEYTPASATNTTNFFNFI